eukprot:3924462-Rhodomonas_salina.2
MPQHCHSLVSVEPRGRVRLPLILPFHALPQNRDARRLEPVPADAAAARRLVRLGHQLAVVEEGVGEREERGVRAEVPHELCEHCRLKPERLRVRLLVLGVRRAAHEPLHHRRLQPVLAR